MKTLKKMLKRSFAVTSIVVAGAIASVPAFAYDDTDEMIIEEKIATMMASMDSQEITPIIDMMPPKMFKQFAEMTGLSNSEVRDLLIAQSNAMMEMLDEEGNSMTYVARFDDAKIMQTEAGRDYVLIPTEASMIMSGIGMDMTGTLLALEDNDEWYLLRIDGQQHLDMLAKAYPDMINIEIFEPTMEEFDVEDMEEFETLEDDLLE